MVMTRLEIHDKSGWETDEGGRELNVAWHKAWLRRSDDERKRRVLRRTDGRRVRSCGEHSYCKQTVSKARILYMLVCWHYMLLLLISWS
jgi:hypothetical protein